MRRCLAVALVGAFSVSFAWSAVGGTERGAQLAASCAACHRLDGRGMPSITGRSAEQLVAALKGFRNEANPNHVMRAVVRSMSDDEIQTVAQYLSAIGKKAERP